MPLQAASVFRGHESRPDRAEGTLYVQPTCLDVQKNLCTVSPKGKSCRMFSARAREQASPCRGCSVRPVNLPGRAENPLHGQAFEKFNLLIYWFQKSGITYPTLQMIRTCLKRRLFDDKNYVFWMGFGFRNSGCGGLVLNPSLRASHFTNWALLAEVRPWNLIWSTGQRLFT